MLRDVGIDRVSTTVTGPGESWKREMMNGGKNVQTYSTPFLWVCAREATRTLELFLVHGHVLVLGLERLPLSHLLLGERLFLVHHGCPYPDQGILVPPLHMEHVLHFV